MRIILMNVALAALLMNGCNKKESTGASNYADSPAKSSDSVTATDKTVSNDLKQFALGFHNYCDSTGKNALQTPLPASIAPLEKFMNNGDLNSPLVARFKSGTYKVFWSAPAKQMIIACEKEAETKGGLVLGRMGDVTKMSAAEMKQELAK